jgi:hypothetical protein
MLRSMVVDCMNLPKKCGESDEAYRATCADKKNHLIMEVEAVDRV